jgi:hypothetical protein
MGQETRGRLVAGTIVAGALVVVAAVVELVRTGDAALLGILAVMPGVLLAAFSGRRSASGCHAPWTRRGEH